MRENPKRRHRRWRQTAALCLAGVTFWTVRVTAGSASAASAVSVLRSAATLPSLREEIRQSAAQMLGSGSLSPAAAIALRQSPLLYAARDSILSGRTTATADSGAESQEDVSPAAQGPSPKPEPASPETENASSETEEDAETAPLLETPVEPVQPLEETADTDNGVRARTLIPTSTSGYTVCGRVYISSTRKDSLNIEALREPFDAELTGDAPQILILHSHGSEAYTPVPGTDVVWSGDSRTTDFRYSVVRAGDEMASVFAAAGISVLHDRTLYDYPNYTGSYDRSLAAINSYLAQYPSIRFILDVHRDYIADAKGNPYKVISEIDGLGTAAQMTLVMGSDASGLSHPRWMENLKLAVAIQEQILSEYPTLMRPVLLRKSRYNQHATTGSLLVEVGAAGNSPEEAFLSARIFAQQMTEVLIARSK